MEQQNKKNNMLYTGIANTMENMKNVYITYSTTMVYSAYMSTIVP